MFNISYDFYFYLYWCGGILTIPFEWDIFPKNVPNKPTYLIIDIIVSFQLSSDILIKEDMLSREFLSFLNH